MLSVIAFWLLPQEEATFLTKLESLGSIVAYPSRAVDDKVELEPKPIAALIAQKRPQQLLFGEAQMAGIVVEARECEGRRLVAITSMRSCVISYRRGQLRDGRLTLSHLSAYWTRLSDAGDTLGEKDPQFISWGKKVFSLVRRETPEWFKYKKYRATKNAKQALVDGTLELVDY